jgi:hypothetical protein
MQCPFHHSFTKVVYEGVSKIFRTDAVKIIKLTIRSIGRIHPRSSSFPHQDTVPTVSSMFGTLPGTPILSVSSTLRFGLDLLIVIKPTSFHLQFHFWKHEEATGCQIKGVRWAGDDSHFVFRQKLLSENGSVRRGPFMVKQPGLFSPKFGATSSQVFTQSPQNCAVEPGIHILAYWDRCFALPQLLYKWRHQSFWIPHLMCCVVSVT